MTFLITNYNKELNVVIVMKLTQGCRNLCMDSIRHNVFIFIKILNSNKTIKQQ